MLERIVLLGVGRHQHIHVDWCVSNKGWDIHGLVCGYRDQCVPLWDVCAWVLTGPAAPMTPLLLCACRGTVAGWGWWWLPTCTTATSQPGESDMKCWVVLGPTGDLHPSGAGVLVPILQPHLPFHPHSADQALDRFAMKRFYEDKVVPVGQPSQKRWVLATFAGWVFSP